MSEYKFQFDMDQVGRKISMLRREQNMTQMELADKLGISFQAVSNWERGNTMPDIGKLPELAEIFKVTTDELLGGAPELLRSAAKGEMERYMEENPVTVEEFAQTAPLLTPAQADAGFEKLTEKNAGQGGIKLKDLEDILPFLGSHLVDELALKCVDPYDGRALGGMAPFVSRQVLEQIADRLVSEGKSIDEIAPFLCTERLDQLAQRYADAHEKRHLEDILPFISEKTLVRLAGQFYETEGVRGIGDFMPFLPGKMKEDIARREYEKNSLRYFENIAPFLNGDYLNALAQEALEKEGINAISPIAPFLDQELLERFVRERYLSAE